MSQEAKRPVSQEAKRPRTAGNETAPSAGTPLSPGICSPDTNISAEAALALAISLQEELEDINDAVATRVVNLHREANVQRAPFIQKRRDAIKSVPGFW